MKRSLFVLAAATAIVAGSLLATAQAPAPAPPAQGGGRGPTAPMTFFVTSTAIGDGGNLGGLMGADAHCQKLAASGVAGAKPGPARVSEHTGS